MTPIQIADKIYAEFHTNPRPKDEGEFAERIRAESGLNVTPAGALEPLLNTTMPSDRYR